MVDWTGFWSGLDDSTAYRQPPRRDSWPWRCRCGNASNTAASHPRVTFASTEHHVVVKVRRRAAAERRGRGRAVALVAACKRAPPRASASITMQQRVCCGTSRISINSKPVLPILLGHAGVLQDDSVAYLAGADVVLESCPVALPNS